MSEIKEAQAILHSIMKAYHINDVGARICSILYLSPESLSLEELSQKTKYSLATISNTVKFLSDFFLIVKVKKPGTKKVYVTGRRSPIEMMEMKTNLILRTEIKPIKEQFPKLIKKLKGNKKREKELELIKKQYAETLKLERIIMGMKKLIEKEKL